MLSSVLFFSMPTLIYTYYHFNYRNTNHDFASELSIDWMETERRLKKKTENDFTDSVELMTPLTSPIFDFHWVVSVLKTPTTTPIPIPTPTPTPTSKDFKPKLNQSENRLSSCAGSNHCWNVYTLHLRCKVCLEIQNKNHIEIRPFNSVPWLVIFRFHHLTKSQKHLVTWAPL